MVSYGQNHDFHGKKNKKNPHPHPQDLPRALRGAMPGSAAPGAPKAHLRSENAAGEVRLAFWGARNSWIGGWNMGISTKKTDSNYENCDLRMMFIIVIMI